MTVRHVTFLFIFARDVINYSEIKTKGSYLFYCEQFLEVWEMQSLSSNLLKYFMQNYVGGPRIYKKGVQHTAPQPVGDGDA